MNYRQVIINTLIIRDGDNCRICSQPFTDFAPPELDHIEAKSNGGNDSLYNLHLVHSICNVRKGKKKWPGEINQDPLSDIKKRFVMLSGGSMGKLELLKAEIVKTALSETNNHLSNTSKKFGISRRQLAYFLDKNHLR